VTWKTNSRRPNTGSFSYFKKDNPQCYRNTCPSIEHLIQTTVSGVFVVSRVASKTSFPKQVTAEDFELRSLSFVTPVRYLLPCFDAHAVKTLEGWLGVEMRVFEPGDEQRCAC
tara:strand:- start:2935 stop:3273 length:339 start_codon:yes stop_codon:yes gene_type:complete